MQTHPPAPALVRIALFCLLVALLGLLPYPLELRRLSQEARAAEAQRQPARAAAAYRALLQIQPWRGELWEQTGRLELQAGQTAEGTAALEEARARGLLSADGWLLLADASATGNQPEKAGLLWQAYLARFGPSPAVYTRLLALQRGQGDLTAALDTLRAWQQAEPANPRPLYLQGLFLLRDQPDTALPLLLRSARLDPGLSPAVEVLRKAVGQAGASPQPAYGKVILGRALGSLGEWDLARGLFTDAVQLAPEYAEAWAFLGEARQNLGEDGLPELQKAARLAPDSVTVQALLSVYWRRQGEPRQALAALEKIRAAEPDQVIWQIETGNTLAESGDLVAALPFFQQAVKMEPGNLAAWLALARFSIDYEVDISGTGLPAARQALLLSPDHPQVLDGMGQAFFKLGDLVSAERFLQRSLAQDSSRPAPSLHLGQVYLQQNRLDLAYAPLSAAARLDPQGPEGALAQRLLATYFPGSP